MKNAKHCIVLFFALMFLLCMQTAAMAEGGVSVLGIDVKAVGTISSGTNIKIAWEVKARNETAQPITKEITVTFLDNNREPLGKVSKIGTFDAGRVTTITDTVILPSDIAQRIRTGVTSWKTSN